MQADSRNCNDSIMIQSFFKLKTDALFVLWSNKKAAMKAVEKLLGYDENPLKVVTMFEQW